MPPVSRNSPSDQQDPPKSLCLRPSSLLAACFLVVAAVALAYVGGVMSGRAYWRGHPAQVSVAGGALKKGVVVEPAEEDVPKQKILAAEELRFARVLRGESLPPGMTDGPQARTPAAAAMQPVGAPTAQAAGQRSQVPAPANAPTAGANAGQAAQPVPENHPVVLNSLQPVGNMFDYVFQVGAFKDEESVDSLRQRLEGRGLRTRLQRSGKLLVILVLLRGNEARAAEVVHACEGLNLGKPILRSKTPVKQ
ncbi:MAG: SPOR domain-containing protein [Desulfovibrio sp.]|uniref:SPOR domain-containing protein n=1 Tax=Desulfovibrio sp. TaxID=885 RepID=UPI002A3601BD|nr:SPOR domain-containing protein [Desulfovibrio sp.]MDY0258885.1 SPOR domain-containing protein [Desulfovibrio sp.]